MAVLILEGKKVDGNGDTSAALYCGTTGVALECHLFEDADQAQRFLDWLPRDARDFSPAELGAKWSEFYDVDAKREEVAADSEDES